MNYIDNIIKVFKPSSKYLLELGSGTGKHSKLLTEKGYIVHGIERSVEMVEIAERELVEGLSYQVGDISTFSSTTKFDVVLSLFHVICYLTDNALLKATFTNTFQNLNDKGIFIFDVWHSPAVYVQKPETRIKRLNNEAIYITRLAEPVVHYDENIVDVNYEIIIEDIGTNHVSKIRETHSMRHFSKPEIKLLAQSCGFEVLKSEEFLSGEPPGPNTWGVCYILEKISNG